MDMIDIKIPAPPDGMEIVQSGVAQAGDLRLISSGEFYRWREACEGVEYVIIARKKQTAADWANKQPLLGVLAKMCHPNGFATIHADGKCCIRDCGGAAFLVAEKCPIEFNGEKLKPKGGKWVDA